MKKVFAILAIAGFMVACNNDSETENTVVDSTAIKDSIEKASKMNMSDTTMMPDTMPKMDTNNMAPQK
jgi:hypothetical protein